MASTARADDTTVRIDRKTDAVLSQLARKTGAAKKRIIAEAVERYRRDSILNAASEGFARMKGDSEAWDAEVSERSVWSGTVSDGLADE